MPAALHHGVRQDGRTPRSAAGSLTDDPQQAAPQRLPDSAAAACCFVCLFSQTKQDKLSASTDRRSLDTTPPYSACRRMPNLRIFS